MPKLKCSTCCACARPRAN